MPEGPEVTIVTKQLNFTVQNKVIKDILQTPKKDITRSPVKIKKESIWKRILKKLKNL